jgi:hypothetical protein
MIDINTEADEILEEIILPGKLNDKLKSIVSNDNKSLSESFDPDRQCERLCQNHFHDIVKHPEFSVIAVQKLIRQASGQIARSGVALLLDSMNHESGQFQLIVEAGLTIKIDSNQYVPLAVATSTHLNECASRIEQSAELKVSQAARVRKLVNTITDRMNSAGVSFFGDLATDGEIKFSLQ